MEEILKAAEQIGISPAQRTMLEDKIVENRKLIEAMKSVCPECKQGKHGNCDGHAGLTDDDDWIPCECVNGVHRHDIKVAN